MNYKNTKIILFAGLIALISFPFVAVDTVYASSEDLLEKAEEGKKLIKKIERINEKLADETLKEKKRERLEKRLATAQAELEPLLKTLNDAGLYTPGQFDDAKAKMIASDIGFAQAVATTACSECPETVYFKAGYDWRILGFWEGSTVATSWSSTQGSLALSATPATGSWGIRVL